MPLIKDEDFETNADETKNNDYCAYCYAAGKFTQDVTMEGMILCAIHDGSKQEYDGGNGTKKYAGMAFPIKTLENRLKDYNRHLWRRQLLKGGYYAKTYE
jgi:hypothetical protein